MTKDISTIDYSDQRALKTLQETVAKDSTPEEFKMFIEICKASRLNPYKKEIWFIKAQGRVFIQTGINGYWAIANQDPQFDGAETGFILPDGSWVKTAPGEFIGAWCRVHRKDRKIPIECQALLRDYKKGSPNWNSSPGMMILKVAESLALRKSFVQELGGTYTEEEIDGEPLNVTPAPKVDAPPAPERMYKYDLQSAPNEQLDAMVAYLQREGAVNVEAGGFIWTSNKELPKLVKFEIKTA